MRSGRLKDRIVIQSQPDLTDEHGEEVKTYNQVFKAKCNFRVISGVELLKAGVTLNVEVASILMRTDNRLQYDHLVLHKGNRYEISSIKPAEKPRESIVTVTREIT